MKKPANTRVKLYFRQLFNNQTLEEEKRYEQECLKPRGMDYVDDLIDSHSRQRYLISLDNDREKEYQKVPKWIRKLFGCTI